MEELSIDQLFSCKTKKGQLDVQTLVDNSKPNSIDYVNLLVRTKKDRERKLRSTYERFYVLCWEKIKLFNSVSKYDMIYTVPLSVSDCIDYSADVCLSYIKSKMKNTTITIIDMSYNSIYISWRFINQ